MQISTASKDRHGSLSDRHTILLVDDDEAFRHGLAENLREDGHGVLEYSDPTEIPPLTRMAPVDLLITDYLMKGEDGLTFARRFHAAHPSVPVLLVTICCTPPLDGSFVSVLSKPFAYDQLHEIVHALTAEAATLVNPNRRGRRQRKTPVRPHS